MLQFLIIITPVTKGVGRFGPYIKWSGLFINVNKKYDFDNLTENDITTLIEEKIQKEKIKLFMIGARQAFE